MLVKYMKMSRCLGSSIGVFEKNVKRRAVLEGFAYEGEKPAKQTRWLRRNA